MDGPSAVPSLDASRWFYSVEYLYLLWIVDDCPVTTLTDEDILALLCGG